MDMIGAMNLLLQFNVYQLTQDAAGGVDKSIVDSYSDWCKIEQVNGSRRLESSQISFNKAFKITKRHYTQRPIDVEVTEIIYGVDTLSINDVKLITEGRTTYEEILCYTAPK